MIWIPRPCPHVNLKGIFSHDGFSYGAANLEECRKISEEAQRRTLRFADLAREHGMACETVSYGATPTFMIGVEILEYPSTHIKAVYDEHAIIIDRAFHNSVQAGHKVRIIPVHICPVCNLYDSLYLISGDEAAEELPILCRGKLT